MIKILSKFVVTLFVLSLFGYFAYVYVIPKLSEHEQKQTSSVKETALVKRVIDGDTFEVEFNQGKKERVRLLGIDSPEKFESSKLDKDAERTGRDKKTIQRLGQLASDFVKNLAEGKRVVLIPESNYEDKDVYGRLLRYIYLEDGTFVNKKIIDEGYATAFRKYPISKLDDFIQAENIARKNNKGLWGDADGLKQLEGTGTKKNSK